ncbi:50S ribosomal protein L25/general stress protein Ctc [Pontibacillus litoralis]|uniref:Large ribosomal subunit protein bL25 n=1 Tax=Pontibacillus litoralis JSM 072002 TaxID=1385512 RepID=A0A0A5G093_9BACI|nr:50S ribosomal protein L25/general stress protein Ctc [Pontibacillus litoralis]KGX85479.1 50S ribosomal protein L25 [Pontibacillus litoralis JSM 072002]
MAITLKAKPRNVNKRTVAKLLRSEGRVPAIVYGQSKEPIPISVDSVELLKTLRDEGRNVIISLDLEGQSPVNVMLQEHQMEPIRNTMVHADFYRIDLSSEVDVQVPIHLEGEAQGVKDGGILSQPLHELAVRAKPNEIPEMITIDVSPLEVNDSLLVSDLKDGRHYEIMEDESAAIVTILPPQTEAVVESGETQDGDVEPEVINQKGEKHP